MTEAARGRWPWQQRPRPLRWFSLLPLLLIVAVSAHSCAFYELVRSYHIQPGPQPPLLSADGAGALAAIVRATPRRLLSSVVPERIPRLHVTIEPRHFARLSAKRDEALRRHFLLSDADDLVPAVLVHGDQRWSVRVRLKGDLTDHLLGDKWSLRVEVQGDAAVLGMRRFSLQAPHTRDHQAEPLFLEYLRRHDVLAPRYFFVDVTLNNRHVGRMALEEHFSTELLEHQQRRDAPIVRFDEQWFYAAELAFMDLVPDYDNWRNAPPNAFRSARIDRSPLQRAQRDLAFGLLRGLADGRLAASDALDVERWARLLAACEIWSRPHLTHWNNLRFYLNPITLRIEPIGFDSTGEQQDHPGLRCMGGAHAMMTDLLEDPVLRSAFLVQLARMSDEVMSEGFAQWFAERESLHLTALRSELPWIEPLSLDRLRMRVQALRVISAQNFDSHVPARPVRTMPHPASADYPIPVHATLERTGEDDAVVVELASAISLPVVVSEIRLERSTEDGDIEVRSLPVYQPLPGTPWPLAPERARIDLPWTASQLEGWRVGGRALVGERSHGFVVLPGFGGARGAVLPEVSLADALVQHPFLTPDSTGALLSIGPGVVDVRGSLVVPKDLTLRIEPGTRLRFEPGAMLIARGDLDFAGTDGAPIVLEARAGDWGGLVVLGGPASIVWSFVSVRDTAGSDDPAWGLSGGVTFYMSDVTMNDCRFEGTRAEDALNVVRSTISLRRVDFRDTVSDALDADFCSGEIVGGHYDRSGGDGIDLSGSIIVIRGVRLERVRDKALSIGEASRAEIAGVTIVEAGTGVASKDGSTTRISDSTLRDIRHAGLMAYVKKQEYGPAELIAARLHIEAAAREAIAQRGSRIRIGEHEVAAEDVDVDALYSAGPMMKDAR